MIYVNGAGMWLRCACLPQDEPLPNRLTMNDLFRILTDHRNH